MRAEVAVTADTSAGSLTSGAVRAAREVRRAGSCTGLAVVAATAGESLLSDAPTAECTAIASRTARTFAVVRAALVRAASSTSVAAGAGSAGRTDAAAMTLSKRRSSRRSQTGARLRARAARETAPG